MSSLPTKFSSPPLLPGFVSALEESLGRNVKPTPIQALSLKWLFENNLKEQADGQQKWKEFLLASETGSGKSIAYLLPLLQGLKVSEKPISTPNSESISTKPVSAPEHAPRALILAPTHELARQLSGFAKSLLHDVKLRIMCASRANARNRDQPGFSSEVTAGVSISPSTASPASFPVDVMVGTPVRLMEMIRGRGWDWERASEKESRLQDEERKRERETDPWDTTEPKSVKSLFSNRKRVASKELGLENIEWVIVDEADVLFDPDFQETTRQILADISAARGVPMPEAASTPTSYPFNLVLTSATIPTSLSTYISTHHPDLIRLASPRLHRLPKTLKTEYVAWTHGTASNARWRDVERQVREIWQDDVKEASFQAQGSNKGQPKLSKVLIFVNKSVKVDELGEYLDGKGIKTVALTGKSEDRKKGSNHHLDGFLRERGRRRSHLRDSDSNATALNTSPTSLDPSQAPHVLITTSLLSRGLDFSPEIKNVFIVDEPRNMIDFIHRAGRTGRAGEKGRVVIFGKMKGRGSLRSEEVKKRVGVLSGGASGKRK
ncbi:P-loop containing nucleoside triphosphate hydrolase protein [Pluteus cervinus]|uniref:P-loop containing nucleoside triphosphate hydrolase protein n=1 Tax=Pluteus cervinus TaxID=181527 RepID=A0ACD3AU95_9AGAR|nr:P-loop containing nucleoside triphosphate hydrolase protein [Pluteus cervinus]